MILLLLLLFFIIIIIIIISIWSPKTTFTKSKVNIASQISYWAKGSFFVMRELSKNVDRHGLPKTNNWKNQHLLKRPKVAPKNEIWTKVYMIQNLLFRAVFFKENISGIQLFIKKGITRNLIIFKKPRKMISDFFSNYIFVHTFQWT